MWIGLFFSMMCLSLLAPDISSPSLAYEVDQQWQQITLYREKTVQCLIMAEYTNGGPYVLETFIHYIYIEFGIRPDADKDVWFLLSVEVQLAMRMGYHRDPSHFQKISPFDGEMRRRLWATVLLGDILISSQMGMPRTVVEAQCDTAEPRNFEDEDLFPGMVELPASRPEVEITASSSVIVRRRLAMLLGEISDLTASTKPTAYAEVMRLDRKLNEAADNIPTALRTENASSAAITTHHPPQLTMARIFITHLVYKGRVMLHQRFLHTHAPFTGEDTFAYSRKTCIDACLATLRMQRALEDDTRPGGPLHVLRWRVTSSMNHQFLTATMLLCALLHRGAARGREEEITAALGATREIWERRSGISREARRAAGALRLVLGGAGSEGWVGGGGMQSDRADDLGRQEKLQSSTGK